MAPCRRELTIGFARLSVTLTLPVTRSRMGSTSGRHSAAEKAVKALFQSLGAEARGHSITQLLASLPPAVRPPETAIEDAKELERHYIGPRYPNSYPEGAPGDFYTEAEAQRAIATAERVIEHCQRHLVR